jgi:cytochrome c oxidase subunit II
MGRWIAARRLAPALLIAMAAPIFSACEAFSSPQNTFSPAGEVAKDQKFWFLFVMWPALVIMVGVLTACLVIPIVFRQKKGDPGLPKQVHGNTVLELGWTIAPAILLAVIAVPTVAGIQKLADDPGSDALNVHVEGQRFLWRFTYSDVQLDDGSGALVDDPDVLHIPVGRDIDLRITSIDVNHSFWIPKLAGKTDAIQNHPNKMWLRADEPGIFEGQCAEFCGLDHANMRFQVVAMPEDEFNAWLAEQDATEIPGSGDVTPSATPEGTPPPPPPPPPPGGVVIDLDDNVFVFNGEENPTLQAAANTEVTFNLNNVGNAIHNMHIAVDGFDADLCDGSDNDPCSEPDSISGGDTGTITFNLPAGTYDYRCDFHTSEMSGTLEVQ